MSSVGIARTGVEVAIFDADDRPLPPGRGRRSRACAATRSWPAIGTCRRNRRPRCARAGCTQATSARWTTRGFLTLLDRAKDLIISGGSNIYPREVEEVLLEDPDLAEVAVIGVPDPEWGESVMAVLVAAPGANLDLARLEQLCLDRIARFKRPKHWRVVDALPKNSAGKVLKRELRQRFQAPAAKTGA